MMEHRTLLNLRFSEDKVMVLPAKPWIETWVESMEQKSVLALE